MSPLQSQPGTPERSFRAIVSPEGDTILKAIISQDGEEIDVPWGEFERNPNQYGYTLSGSIEDLKSKILLENQSRNPPPAQELGQRPAQDPGSAHQFLTAAPEAAPVIGVEDPSVSGLGIWERTKLSYSDNPRAELEDHFGPENVAQSAQGLAFRRSETEPWKLVDEEGFDFLGDVVADFAGDVPELLGGAVGYALGTGAGAALTGPGAVYTGIAGGGIGTAAGRFVRQRIADVLGVKRAEGWDATRDIAISGLIGAGAEIGAAVVFRALPALTRKMSPGGLGGMTDDKIEVLNTIREVYSTKELEKIGKYGLTPAQMTVSRVFGMMEGFAESAIKGGSGIVKAKEKVVQRLVDRGVKKVAKEFATEAMGTPREVGKIVGGILEDQYRLWKAPAQELRNFVESSAAAMKGTEIILPTSQPGNVWTREAALKWLKDRPGAGSTILSGGESGAPFKAVEVGIKGLTGAKAEAASRLGIVVDTAPFKRFAEPLAATLKQIKGFDAPSEDLVRKILNLDDFIDLKAALSVKTGLSSIAGQLKAAGNAKSGYFGLASKFAKMIDDEVGTALKSQAPRQHSIGGISARFAGRKRQDYTLYEMFKLSNRVFRIAEERFKPTFLHSLIAVSDPKTASKLGKELAPEQVFNDIFSKNVESRLITLDRVLPLNHPNPQVRAIRNKISQHGYNKLIQQSMIDRPPQTYMEKILQRKTGLGTVAPEWQGTISGEKLLKNLTDNLPIGQDLSVTQASLQKLFGKTAYNDLIKFAKALKVAQHVPNQPGKLAATLVQVGALTPLIFNPGLGTLLTAGGVSALPALLSRYTTQGPVRHSWRLAQFMNHKGGKAVLMEGFDALPNSQKGASIIARLIALETIMDRADDKFLESALGEEPDDLSENFMETERGQPGDVRGSLTPSRQ